jgi:hypothetical protein
VYRGKPPEGELLIKIRWGITVAAWLLAAGVCGTALSRAQETKANGEQLTVSHPECSFFGADRERFLPRNRQTESDQGRLTRQFAAAGSNRAGVERRKPFEGAQAGHANLIDQYIWADLQANNITPAGTTTDYEFIRRVTLDLTGRIPTATRVNQFVADRDPDKRANLVGELLAKPEWVDKWTMYFGDLYKNTASNTQVAIHPEGRNAFYKYLHDSLAANKPYNQMATEIIAAQGTNSFDQTNGQINYYPLGIVGGGPVQDIFDNQTANVADQFLGIAHVNCLLCHNGAGHLTTLSLWGGQTTRVKAWGLSAFVAHTWTHSLATPKDPNNPNASDNYYSLDKYTTDYALNTTTGNRPPRQPIGTVKTVTPAYLFGGQTPNNGEDYRTALARLVTNDPQFARAAVNYMWAEFFGMGMVDPPDQFDPLRLDPNNLPPAPWTLQPTNAKLLNALAQQFTESGYDLQALMRLIVNSDTYQLASDYSGTWNPAWETYFARKFVRRLWSEEIHDSIVTAINTLPSYTVAGFTSASTVYGVNSPGFGKISYAMQAPDVVNMPDGGGAVSQFLDTFLRGNRDDQPRKSEGSILQALSLMNDNFVESRIHATGTGSTTTFLMNLLPLSNTQLVNTLYLDVLSRFPSATELNLALQELSNGGTAARKTNAEDLLWTLFNKVDFVFNY